MTVYGIRYTVYGLLLLLLLIGCTTDEPAQAVAEGNDAFVAGQYDVAAEAYTLARVEGAECADDVECDLAVPLYNTANTQYRQQNFNEALGTLEQTIPNSADTLTQHSYFNLGNIYFSQMQYELAVEAYKEALRLNPDDMDAKVNLELALQHLQQEQEQEEQEQEQEEQEQEDEGDEGEDEGQEPSENPPTPTPEPTPEDGEGDEEQDQEDSADAEPEDPSDLDQNGGANPNDSELSEAEARQLLDAIGQDTQTLQERLQQQFFVPGNPPEEDW